MEVVVTGAMEIEAVEDFQMGASRDSEVMKRATEVKIEGLVVNPRKLFILHGQPEKVNLNSL